MYDTELEACILAHGREIYSFLYQMTGSRREADVWLNRHILSLAKEGKTRLKRGIKIRTAVLAAVGVLALGSMTAFAAWKYLSLSQVAKEFGDRKLSDAFQGDQAVLVNETQEISGYRVTLLGAAAGKNISSFLAEDDQGNIKDDRLYAAVAIERLDGTPMPDTREESYGDVEFYVSPYIQGLDPADYSIASLGGGYGDL